MIRLRPIVVGITGGSGVAYAVRLLDVLLEAGREVHLTISGAAVQVFAEEMGRSINLDHFDPAMVTSANPTRLHYWHFRNLNAGCASGSHQTDGMVIVPCSGSTLASVANGISTNLIHRSADVHLKERRKLILVPRETPLSLVTIENMAAVTRAGGLVMPASPGFYHDPKSISDLVDFIVARICDQLNVEHALMKRWGSA